MLESKFKTKLIKEIKDLFPFCVVIHPDATVTQGLPDLLILNGTKWAALEGKKTRSSSHRPNQDYYVELLGKMSYAAFIFPENKEKILNELQQALRT